VQKTEVRGVDVAFERLHVIAVPMGQRDVAVIALAHDRLDFRQRRRVVLPLTEIGKDQPPGFTGFVGHGRSARRILRLVFQVRLVETFAVHIEFPAVISAANAAMLITSEEQRGTAVRTAVIHHPHAPFGVAEPDQFFAEDHQPHRIAIGNQFGRHANGNPELTEEFPHQRAFAHPAKVDIFFCGDHALLL
jgi:hypothetical protein